MTQLVKERVWTGKDAIDLGLMNVLGGMEGAIAIAAEMANLKYNKSLDYTIEKNPMKKL